MFSDRGAAQPWRAAISALLNSGLLGPPTPAQATRIVRGLWRFGPTPASLLATSAARYPARIAVIDDAGTITYAELQARAEAIAAGLHAVAHEPRSVGILCRNHRGFIEATAAAAQLGCELIFVNTELPAAQLSAVLRRHGPDILIADDEYDDAIAASDFAGSHIHAWRDGQPATSCPSLDSLAAERHPRPPRVRSSVGVTLLTSGTTGLAKGVPRSVNLRSILEMGASAMGITRLRSGDTIWVGPPFFHGFGLVAMFGGISLGATVVCRRRFQVQQMLDDIRTHRADALIAVPVMLQRLLRVPLEQRQDMSSLRVVMTGASPISPATISEFTTAFGPILINGYGSTEAGIVSIATPADLIEAPGTLGRPAIGVSARVLRPDHTDAAVGEIGSIFIRSGFVYSGYSPDPQTAVPAKIVVHDHVDTGDKGHFDRHGRLYIDGRSDDMIVSGGENVFPGEVENALAAHPAFTDVVVIGMPDPEYGQILKAFLVLHENTPQPSVEDLKTHVRQRLERYKVPKEFEFVAEIPRNASGKILRNQLR
ncbi:AMP-binding protein [Nocardia sp. NBC_01388]|uniref:AMP-binding protein n=1 Tax=Nocardia sp. NBC_01388 TaxID=2903596 RepID=UPI00324C0895